MVIILLRFGVLWFRPSYFVTRNLWALLNVDLIGNLTGISLFNFSLNSSHIVWCSVLSVVWMPARLWERVKKSRVVIIPKRTYLRFWPTPSHTHVFHLIKRIRCKAATCCLRFHSLQQYMAATTSVRVVQVPSCPPAAYHRRKGLSCWGKEWSASNN